MSSRSGHNGERVKEMDKELRASTIIDFAHGRLSSEESLEFLAKIESDPEGSKKLNLVVDIMNEAADPRSRLFETRVAEPDSAVRRAVGLVVEAFRSHPVLVPLGGFGVLAAALGILVMANVFMANRFEELAGIDRTAFTWNARGSDNSDLAGAYLYFTNGEYDRSLTLLDRYVHQHPGGDLAPYVHYTTGAVDLLSSRRSYLTVLHFRLRSRVIAGLDELSLAVRQASNQRLKEEARFLRAKGFLMVGDGASAIAELDSLRALDGPRKEEAMQMIERIHALTP